MATDSRFDRIAVNRYDWNQIYTSADYRKLMLSYSGTQMMAELDRVGLLDEIESLVIGDFGGEISRPLVVTLTTGVLA